MHDKLEHHYWEIIADLGEDPTVGASGYPKTRRQSHGLLNSGYGQSLDEIVNGAVLIRITMKW